MAPSVHSFLIIVTDLGESASHLALVVAASIYLLSRGSRRAAVFLSTSFIFSVVAIGFLKLAFIGCHTYFHRPGIRSPSGHAAMSAAVFWAIALLMRSQLDASRRALPLLLTTLLIGGICATRVLLGDHTVSEVIVGLLAGVCSLWAAQFFVWRGKSSAPFDAYALALWCVIAAFIAHGYRLPGENIIQMLATGLRGHVAFCALSE